MSFQPVNPKTPYCAIKAVSETVYNSIIGKTTSEEIKKIIKEYLTGD